MKVDNIKYEKNRVDVRRNRIKNILDWGERNDYPQAVVDIVNGSYTGVACLDIYHKFIFGNGFADSDNYQIVVNGDGATADELLEMVSFDYARFGGFAIHINRNLLGQIVEMRFIPLENVRLCIDDDPKFAGKVALHPDWGGRSHRRFYEKEIEYFDQYDPNLDVYLERVRNAGGIFEYKGEIYLYSNRPDNYPLPIFDSVLTDMSCQTKISNITYQNAARGFLSAGCFAEINEFYDDENTNDREAFEKVGEALRNMQGDENSSSIIHVVVKNKDEIPQLVSMKGENYDKEFSVSRDACKQSIGQAFRQPEELRCEKTASGFATDTMVQAYKVYNSITAKERQVLEREFSALFKQWSNPLQYNFQISPLSYGSETILSRIGSDTADKVVALATNATISIEQRRAVLTLIYGLSEDEANEILLQHADND